MGLCLLCLVSFGGVGNHDLAESCEDRRLEKDAELPDTPFAKVLRGRLSLQYFRTPIGELNRLYNKAYSLYHCNDLIENREAVDRIGWY